MKKLIFLAFIVPINTFAEVSDKMATQTELWLTGLICGLLLAAGLRWSKWLNLIALPLVALFFYFAHDTLAQPDIGPAVLKEQGKAYVLALYGSAILVLIGVVTGNYLNVKRNLSLLR